MTTQREELRQGVEQIFKTPHCESCHEDWDYDTSFKTESCCTRYIDDSIDRVVSLLQQAELRGELNGFKQMRDYYGRGNIKLWDEPDNNFNNVHLDDHIAALEAQLKTLTPSEEEQ